MNPPKLEVHLRTLSMKQKTAALRENEITVVALPNLKTHILKNSTFPSN
jgi:hypothetical protein